MTKLLIITESPGLSEFLCKLLKVYNFDVSVASDTITLNEQLTHFDDLILLDNMFGLEHDRKEIYHSIRKRSNVPVILLFTNSDLQKNYDGFFEGFIEKPFDIPEVLEKIKEVTDHTNAQKLQRLSQE